MSHELSLLRVADVAAAWDVSPQTVIRWIRSGRMPAVRAPSGQYRLTSETLPRAAVAALCNADASVARGGR